MAKQIPVGPSHYAIVDDEDYEELSKFTWHVIAMNRTIHARRETRWRGMQDESQYMHQMITGFAQTDHANGNGLDNRRENLRPATNSQNKMNEPKRRGQYTSTFKGVSWHKKAGKWAGQIMLNRKNKHLGLFHDEKEAARAYDAAARKYFGEFANINFPEGDYEGIVEAQQ